MENSRGNSAGSNFDNAGSGNKNVSHAPLNLVGGATETPEVQTPTQITTKAALTTAASERVKGVKTFFTKLHPGAISFLDEQITNWLTENPAIVVKRTNIVTGEVQAKNTEPNIIVTIWY